MWTPGITEMVIILSIIVLFFGGKKIPEIAKGLGKGIREFKLAKNQVDVTDKNEILK